MIPRAEARAAGKLPPCMTRPTRYRHPAKYTDRLFPVMAEMLDGCGLIVDIFGGTGKLRELRKWLPNALLLAGELEREWCADDMIQADALHLPYASDSIAAICTSPAYGNRMADKLLRDRWRRNTYASELGRELSPGNGAALQWGAAYRDLHRAAWQEAARVIPAGGRLVLNMKDHIRDGQVMPVTRWHVETLLSTGFDVARWERVACPGNRQGANGHARVEHESVILFRRSEHGKSKRKTRRVAAAG